MFFFCFFFKAQKNNFDENLSLALKWNRIDIAKDYIFTGKEISAQLLGNLMEMALLENKSDFVSLFLDNDIQLGKFLTVKRLKNLYNAQRVIEFSLLILM
jgi:hypothetical protein